MRAKSLIKLINGIIDIGKKSRVVERVSSIRPGIDKFADMGFIPEDSDWTPRQILDFETNILKKNSVDLKSKKDKPSLAGVQVNDIDGMNAIANKRVQLAPRHTVESSVKAAENTSLDKHIALRGLHTLASLTPNRYANGKLEAFAPYMNMLFPKTAVQAEGATPLDVLFKAIANQNLPQGLETTTRPYLKNNLLNTFRAWRHVSNTNPELMQDMSVRFVRNNIVGATDDLDLRDKLLKRLYSTSAVIDNHTATRLGAFSGEGGVLDGKYYANTEVGALRKENAANIFQILTHELGHASALDDATSMMYRNNNRGDFLSNIKPNYMQTRDGQTVFPTYLDTNGYSASQRFYKDELVPNNRHNMKLLEKHGIKYTIDPETRDFRIVKESAKRDERSTYTHSPAELGAASTGYGTIGSVYPGNIGLKQNIFDHVIASNHDLDKLSPSNNYDHMVGRKKGNFFFVYNKGGKLIKKK